MALHARYRRIIGFFLGAILSLVYWDLVLPRVGLGGVSQRSRSGRLRQIAMRFRALAIEMGGVLIKVGQFLSARLDVLPEIMTAELAGLQDEVPPEDFGAIRRVAESEFGMPLDQRFAWFDPVPLAAASLGQVHRARLHVPALPPGSPAPAVAPLVDVVVKVQRPNIEHLIAVDLDALQVVARWLMRYGPIRRRVDIPVLLSEFKRVVHEEVDYFAEGRNAEAFAASFKERKGFRVPRVVWTHSTRRVLTLEDVYGIKITDYAAITAAGIDRAEVARRLFSSYLQQIFDDGFFHADPHPGNLFVSPSPDGWVLTFVDFGMFGRISPRMRNGLREFAIGMGTQDIHRMTKAYEMLDMLLPGADITQLEKAEARAFAHFWGKSMTDLRQMSQEEVQAITREFRDLIYRMPFQMPQDLILLGRTVGILSGMCAGLDPDFNLWDNLAPYTRTLIEEQGGTRAQLVMDEVARAGRALVDVPDELLSVLRKLERGEIMVQTPQVAEQMCRMELTMRRVIGGVIFSSMLIGAVQMDLASHDWVAYLLAIGAAVTLLWTVTLRCPD